MMAPMKKILIYAIPAVLVIGVLWAYTLRYEPEQASAQAGTTLPAAGSADDSVLIEVNGEPIRHSEFEAAVAGIPEEMRFQLQAPGARKQFGEELVRLKLLEQEARRMGLDRRNEVAGMVRLAAANVLASAALERLLEEGSDDALRKMYESRRDQYETIRVKQIVVAYQGGRLPARRGAAPSEGEARARAEQAAARLRAGAEFAAVAKEVSDDPRVEAGGGELGVLPRGSLPDELASSLFALDPGQVSDPIRSEFGYHIFQVEEKGLQPFEEVRPQLLQESAPTRSREILEGLRQQATVHFDPEYFESNAVDEAEDPGEGDPAPE